MTQTRRVPRPGHLEDFTDEQLTGMLRRNYDWAMRYKRRREDIPADVARSIVRIEAEQKLRVEVQGFIEDNFTTDDTALDACDKLGEDTLQQYIAAVEALRERTEDEEVKQNCKVALDTMNWSLAKRNQ